MDDQNKNLILATALSFLVILVWFVLFPPPEPDTPLVDTANQSELNAPAAASGAEATVPTAADASTAATNTTTEASTEAAEAARVPLDTPRLTGSVSLLGGRIDDLSLKDYKNTLDPDSGIVRMLTPVGQVGAYYALYGWAAGAGLTPDAVPGPNTIWQADPDATLTPETPVTLTWDNGAGLSFERMISIDADYMFTVTQSVTNTGTSQVALAPYSVLARHGLPADTTNIWVVHEGAVQFAQGEYLETDWNDFDSYAERDTEAGQEARWAGFTDHYWQTVLIAPQDDTTRVETFYDANRDIYQTTAKQNTKTLAAGSTVSVTSQVFAGAKEWETIQNYQSGGIEKFIDSIDWGWFFFLTKPIFWLLHELNALVGNMGWAIIGLTLIIKAVLFPLAYKSYVSMAKMKELQPQMEKLKESAGDDKQKLQQGMMELYKKEKVNPAAGCLPILLQIPIFFSLYKVIFVTIELRHAPWFGPFRDLSAPDPTSIMNLFGLLPFEGPEPGSILALIFIGILPLLLGISMWLQQKLNPAPTDPTQQMIFAWMPWVFMFMLGSFASGLVVYWIANNVITFTQQYLIMRSQGYKPDLLGNIKGSFKKSRAEDVKK
ncbi:membrane protein insertase YidC [uncultured Tateyamaria sp.]|uniref:membrane protein insertase YidC n=1 Tax=uncultured Tateyamaria sp. TaxID=455651 RepID=UPI0026206C8F|nr:membrane protein insertase YidC [uncultured Tateyamaria sp.]